MSYVNGLSDVVARMDQIQSSLADLTNAPSASSFSSVLASIAGLGGPSAATGGVLGADQPSPNSGSITASSGDGTSGPTPEPTTSPSPATVSAASGNSSAATETTTGTPTAVPTGPQVVDDAMQYLGVPYQWGGTDPATGLDCSGLVQRVFADLGVSVPRTSQEQATIGTPVASLADAQAGDLVFFPGSDGTAASPGHVGIYLGNGKMIDAPYTGADVRVDPVGVPTAIRRVVGTATVGSAVMGQEQEASQTGPAPNGSAPSGSAPTAAATSAAAGAASPYTQAFLDAATSYGVPATLLSAVASTESGYDPTAVSSAGAEGLMQLMPSVAASLGVDPFNPSQAIDGAARMLASLHQSLGSWTLAVAGYNAGAGAVQHYGGIPPYPETESYVQKVLSRAGLAVGS
jgi:cell wall-associated NlpC family hydrolase